MSNTPDNKRPRAGQTTLLNIEIIVDENVTCRVNHQQLRAGCLAAASHRNFDEGEIGIRVTTDQAIHQLNREFLGHDYPTDVISFPYSARERRIVVNTIHCGGEQTGLRGMWRPGAALGGGGSGEHGAALRSLRGERRG